MKVSVNWLRQFTDINIPVDELVEKIGAQLGAVEEVIDLGAKYQGIVIAKVVSCEKHPNADRLNVCMIDDGGVRADVERNEQGLVQVVCGAPNVRAGLTVAWIPPSATVPSTYDKDPFVLEARELRGVVSNGMLASPAELALTDNHDGLLEVDLEAAPGTPFAEVYQLNDHIIDIENKMFTHRPDCFGMLGVAREVAGIQNIPFTSPEWYLKSLDRIKPGSTRLALEVRNDVPESTPRFMAIAMADVTIKPSPIIIQSYLTRVGLKPINNIVDITNYLMVLTGQPLHAYDYDKVKALSQNTEQPTIVVRKPISGESLALLNGKTIEPREDAIMIATDKQLIGVGGVMGGADTEVDENTKNIIIECANFDMYSIRRTSMAHGLFTDAVTRFNKGQSPLQNDAVLEEAVALAMTLSSAHVASNVIDAKSPQLQANTTSVTVTASFINTRLGLQLTPVDIQRLLENVEFKVEVSGDELRVWAPFWRTDVEISEDVVEEVGRLYGFDKLPLELPKRDLMPVAKDAMLELKGRIRHALMKSGANEVLTYSFVHGNLLDKVGQDREQAYQLSNALSPDLQYYRISLMPSLLEKIHPNIKAGYDHFALFELGKGHIKGKVDENGLPKEYEQLAFVVASNKRGEGAAFYQAKHYLTTLAEALGVELRFEPLSEAPDHQASKPFDYKRSARVFVGDATIPLGLVGEYTSAATKSLKLPEYAAGFEVAISPDHLLSQTTRYQQLSRYPKVSQDICLKVSKDLSYAELFQLVEKEVRANKPSETHTELTPVDIYQRKDDHDHKQITLRLTITSFEKTLTDTEVAALLDKVAAAAATTFGAERV